MLRLTGTQPLRLYCISIQQYSPKMSHYPFQPPESLDLEQVLQRPDIWRGRSPGVGSYRVVDTGYPALNAGLLHQGWPIGGLIEVCQQNLSHSEWLLMTPALLKTSGGYIVLLNPPALPFCQALIQAGLDLERLLIVQAPSKADFLASFLELARASACDVLLAWQPQQALSYTELRKCLLATQDNKGLYVLFRPASMRQQSSPASLRLLTELTASHLQITIFKQKGCLQTQQPEAIGLSLPLSWQGLLPHRLLDQHLLSGIAHPPTKPRHPKQKSAKVRQLHRGKS